MGLARAPVGGNLLASLGVLAVVALIAFGIPIVDGSLPADRTLSAGHPYDVGGGVSLVPPAGSNVDVTGTRPATDRGTALFLSGRVRLAVVVTPYAGTLSQAATRLSGKITKSTGAAVGGPGQPVRTGQGVAGLFGSYEQPGRLGSFAVFVANRESVEVTASGPADELRAMASALQASVQSLTFEVE
jgi:hypothetical protein